MSTLLLLLVCVIVQDCVSGGSSIKEKNQRHPPLLLQHTSGGTSRETFRRWASGDLDPETRGSSEFDRILRDVAQRHLRGKPQKVESSDSEQEERDLKERGVGGTKPKWITRRVWRKLRRAHLKLSHMPVSSMQRLMRRLGAPVETTKAVAEIKCEECEAIVRPNNTRLATWPKSANWNELIHVDEAEVKLLGGTPIMFCCIVCAATRFTAVVYVPRSNKSLTALELEKCLDEYWCLWAGMPSYLHCDPAAAHTSVELQSWCRRNDITLVPSPGEAHWQRGKVERRIEFFKDLFLKVVSELNIHDEEDERLLWHATRAVCNTMNTNIMEAGFSAYQSVFGRHPKQVTSLINNPGALGAHDAINDNAEAAIAEACRASALRSFYELDCDRAVRHALTRGNWGGSKRPIRAGDVIFFFRESQSGTSSKLQQKLTGWQGPCVALFRQGTSCIWASYGFSIMLLAPEQCRHATPEELSSTEVIDELVGVIDQRFAKRLRGQTTFLDARDGERYVERNLLHPEGTIPGEAPRANVSAGTGFTADEAPPRNRDRRRVVGSPAETPNDPARPDLTPGATRGKRMRGNNTAPEGLPPTPPVVSPLRPRNLDEQLPPLSPNAPDVFPYARHGWRH